MIIQHNMHAMFTERQLGVTTKDKEKSQEKLSSGYKINRAADNAAGLVISEKMRKQIRGLDRGEDNICEGIDLVKIADGAMAEVCDELQRMRELSIQAYNETNSDSDRKAIQAEIEQIKEEINRTGTSTKYNDLYIFRDSWKAGKVTSVRTWESAEYEVIVERWKNAPDWLMNNSDQKLEIHGYNMNAGDHDGSMKITYKEPAFYYVYEEDANGNRSPIIENGAIVTAKVDGKREFDENNSSNILYFVKDANGALQPRTFDSKIDINKKLDIYSFEYETDSNGRVKIDPQTEAPVIKTDGNGNPLVQMAGGKPLKTGGSYYDVYHSPHSDTTYYYRANHKPDGYYAPQPDIGSSNTYFGVWDEKITNNPSAKFDFSAIAGETDASALLLKMVDLLGTSLGTPCGSCNYSEYNSGVTYTGTIGNYSAVSNGYFKDMAYNWSKKTDEYARTPSATVDLGELTIKIGTGDDEKDITIYDATKELMKTHMDPDCTLTDAQKADEVKELAQKIATAIRDASVDAMNADHRMNNHFDRVIKGDDPYSFIIYDYRDTDVLQIQNTHSDILTTGRTTETLKVTDTMTEEVTLDTQTQRSVKIHCSGDSSDYLSIDLPTLDLDYLGLTDYRIDGWRTWYDTIPYKDYDARNLRNQAKLSAYDEAMNQYRQDYERWWDESHPSRVVDRIEPYEVEVDDYTTVTEFKNGEPTIISRKTGSHTVTQYKEIFHWEFPPGALDREPKEPEYPALEDLYYTVGHKTVGPGLVDEIDAAFEKLMKQRSYLGAIQNRLEHAQKINLNTAENTTAAESEIRDTDMAKEITRYSKSSILEQAGQAMLTQANQSTNGVLSLLQ